jgi:two-component system CheB/CheR fusion protein
MSGMDLLCCLQEDGRFLPSIVTSGNHDLAVAVQAMKLGAADYLIKPIRSIDLLSCIERVLAHSCFRCKYSVSCISRIDNQNRLTARQKQIMALILAGHPSKNIAHDLGINQRTVETHRAEIMKKTGSKSIPELARVSLATPWNGLGDSPACFASSRL